MVIFLRDYIEVGIESIALLLKLTDGSPSGYYYSKSTVDDTNKWFMVEKEALVQKMLVISDQIRIDRPSF